MSKHVLIFIALTLVSLGPVASAGQNSGQNSGQKSVAKSSLAKPAVDQRATQTDALSEPPLLAGNQISVIRWDALSKTLIVALVEEPGVGPNICTMHDFLDAVDFEDRDQRNKFMTSPNLLKGLTFTLKRNLKLILYEPGAKNVPAQI